MSQHNIDALMQAEESLKNYRDYQNTLDAAKEEGRLEEKYENARSLKALGVPLETLAQGLGLSIDEIRRL